MSEHPSRWERCVSGRAGLALAAGLLAALGALTVAFAQAPPVQQPVPRIAVQQTGPDLTGDPRIRSGSAYTTPVTRSLYLPLLLYGYPPPPPCFSLTLGVDPAGRGTVDAEPPPNCDADLYEEGTAVQLAAVAVPGWDFAGWQGDLGGSANPAELVMDANRVVTATFVLEEYTLTTATTGQGSVAVEPLLPVYPYGDLVTLVALPEPGWSFAGWTGDLMGGDNPAHLTMDGDKTVTAAFLSGQIGPLVYAGHTIDDDAEGASQGNGDGEANCGETLELAVDLRNSGEVIALGVKARASTDDAQVSWPQVQSSYPDLPGAATASGDAPFVLAVAPTAADGHLITVTLTISAANAGTWTSAFTLPVTCKPDERTVQIAVAASEDDAQEEATDGSVDLSSPVLELGGDAGSQVTGLRFQRVAVPQGATVTEAYIEFAAAVSDSQPASLVFQGEASDNAAAFAALSHDITTRTLTVASVAWDDVLAWEAGEGVYRTPDLSSILQEVVNREGWSECHALAFLVHGTGQRTAVAYDGDPDLAPRLHVTYQVPPLAGWDPRLDLLGVYVDPAPVVCGQSAWRLVEARWADPSESGFRHHIFFDVLDEAGERVMGQPVVVTWPTGSVVIYVDKPPSEWGTNFPMYHTLGSYDAYVGGGLPSDRVLGMGMGTPEYPDVKLHTCFYLTFQRVP